MGTMRAVIFVNGELKDPKTIRDQLRAGDLVVAADGGLRHLDGLGLQPSLIIGDLDSAPAERITTLEEAGVEVRHYPRTKDQTDLELALQAVQQKGCREILVAAAYGDRVDHTLGNVFLLALPWLEECKVRLDDGETEAFLVLDAATISGREGDIVSLIPLGGDVEGVVTSGLQYALKDEALGVGGTRAISNVMVGTQASISVRQGRLLCVHRRQGEKNE